MSQEDDQKALRALNLRIAGVDWDVIAASQDYPDPTDAMNAVYELAYAQYGGPPMEPERVIEVLRLDRLHTVVWKQAMQGDVDAARTIIGISDRRRSLMRLNQRAQE